MRRILQPVRLDRRAFAATELALALPVVVLMLLGMADMVQLGRGHLRAQSAAMQIGYIISQCEQYRASTDDAVLGTLTKQLLGTFTRDNAQWALRITAFGQQSDGTPITWSVLDNGGAERQNAALSVTSKGSALPTQPDGTPYQMGSNNLLFRTEVFLHVDTATLLRAVSGIAQISNGWDFSKRYDSVRGEAVHSTRAASTDNLRNTTASKGCLA